MEKKLLSRKAIIQGKENVCRKIILNMRVGINDTLCFDGNCVDDDICCYACDDDVSENLCYEGYGYAH